MDSYFDSLQIIITVVNSSLQHVLTLVQEWTDTVGIPLNKIWCKGQCDNTMVAINMAIQRGDMF
jgi:hypothetical protein